MSPAALGVWVVPTLPATMVPSQTPPIPTSLWGQSHAPPGQFPSSFSRTFVPDWLCDLGQVPIPLWASVSLWRD